MFPILIGKNRMINTFIIVNMNKIYLDTRLKKELTNLFSKATRVFSIRTQAE